MGSVNLHHNSQQVFFRSPFGAVAVHTMVSIRFEVVSESAPSRVWLRGWHDPVGEQRLPMTEEKREGERRVFRCSLTAPASPGLFWYYFIAEFPDRLYYYGAQEDGLGGPGQQYDGEPAFSYQLTVYAADTASPDWFKETILYQIFPDRFFNGNAGGSILNPPKGSLLHPYWEDTPFYVRDMRTGAIFAYDFFGGNLQGVLAKLPYLKELGIGAIYLNPIFEAPSNHRYDTGDYKQVDPMLGDNQLFGLLCAKAKENGIHFILDGVFSHTGSDSRYFNREGRYPELGAYQSTESPYFSWYRFSEYPRQYEAWWGIGTLPNVNEMEPSYLNFIMEDDNSVVRHWFKAGVKGWRLDVADELPDEFIERLRRVMKETDADSVLIGEVWEDASRKTSYGSTRRYLLGNELDSVMNYPFRSCLIDFMLGRQDAAQVQRLLTSLFENYSCQHFYAAMNLLGSHDVPRVLTLLGEAPPPEEMSIIDQANYRLPADKRLLAVRRLKLLVLWQMTFPGAPCIYYGDEAGAEGYTDPFNRGTYPWGREDRVLLDWYRQCTGIRNRYALLRTGEWLPFPVSGDVYGYARRIRSGRDAFGRSRPNNYAVMLLNRNVENSHTVAYTLEENCREFLYDAFDGSLVKLQAGQLTLTLPPLTGRLLVARKEETPRFKRGAGILLHPASLPSRYGIGGLGPEAYQFADWLAQSGQTLWQVLPLNPPGLGNSPYQSMSAFAGNELLISPELLAESGLLTAEEISDPPEFPPGRVEYAAVRQYKECLLKQAFQRFWLAPPDTYTEFEKQNQAWLENYSLFMALKSHFGQMPWWEWDKKLSGRNAQALERYRSELAETAAYYSFTQYIFFMQWRKLKLYANAKGISLVGDLPIFAAHDSADVWANPHLFELDEQGRPLAVAGVPPDYFSQTGQLWGNPLYDWQTMKQDEYRWWRARLEQAYQLADIVRIDHFRGFDAFWRIPAGAETAEAGSWVAGPGADFFLTLGEYLGQLPIIAEDLGIITPPVEHLRDMFNFPGMKVLHFLLEAAAEDPAVLEGMEPNSVIYSGTHDNDTTLGWYRSLREERPEIAAAIARLLDMREDTAESGICRNILNKAYASEANTAILPLQDVLCLGSEARMNRPGTVDGNWQWRFEEDSLSAELAEKLASLVILHNR